MKILLISPLPPPEGGIAVWTQKYKTYCEAHGQELSIVNTALIGRRAAKINSHRDYFSEVKRTSGVLRALNGQLRRQQFDVVHLNTSCSKFGIYRDLICAKHVAAKHIPLIIHCRCNIQDQLNGVPSAVHTFERMVHLADQVLTLNHQSYAYVEKIMPGKAITVPNFVKQTALNDTYQVRDTVRQAVFVGHVQKEKGAEEILHAAEQLPDIRFQLIGPVHSAIQELPRTPNVEFVGKKNPDQIQEFLANADVFLFPSYTEGFSNALAEAMASGLPVIATGVGANEEMLEGQGGIIVPVGNAQEIVTAFHRLEDRETRVHMSSWNIQKIRNTYLIDRVMDQLFSIYSSAIQSHH